MVNIWYKEPVAIHTVIPNIEAARDINVYQATNSEYFEFFYYHIYNSSANSGDFKLYAVMSDGTIIGMYKITLASLGMNFLSIVGLLPPSSTIYVNLSGATYPLSGTVMVGGIRNLKE